MLEGGLVDGVTEGRPGTVTQPQHNRGGAMAQLTSCPEMKECIFSTAKEATKEQDQY